MACRCLNCGSTTVAKYCASCGQDTRDSRQPLDALGVDFWGGRSKLWRTLTPLLLRPGYLTNEYISGRRARYFHPRKMYFFVSIVFFLLFALFRESRLFQINKDPRTMGSAEIVKTANDMAQTANMVGGEVEWFWRVVEPRVVALARRYINLPTIDTGPTLRARIQQQLRHLEQMDPELLRERFSRSVANNTPRMFFLLLPVFALVVMLTHRNQKRYYVEHLIFAFHAQVYVFAVASLALIYEHFAHDTRGGKYALLLTLPYLLLSQHAVYKDSWPVAAAKLTGIVAIYGVILIVGITALVALTFWTI